MSVRGDDLFTIADVLDSQLVSKDGKELGRVADVEAQWDDDRKLVLTVLLAGPQALAGRVLRPLRSLLQRLLHDRFERTIPLCEVEEFGPTLQLRGNAEDYALGQADRWLAKHVLKWIPGSRRL